MAGSYKHQKTLTYSIYADFAEVLVETDDVVGGGNNDWSTPIYAQDAEKSTVLKTITWTIGSGLTFESGYFLDGSPWVKDNGDINLLAVTPESDFATNAFYEKFKINETVINPDLGKAVSSQIGQTSTQLSSSVQDWESVTADTQYASLIKIGKTCIPNKAFLNWNLGWTDKSGTEHTDGGDKGFSYEGIDEQTATDWIMYKLITDTDTGAGNGTVGFHIGWDGRGSLAPAARAAPRDEPPADNTEAQHRGMVYIDKDGSVHQGVDPVDQDWLFNWQSGYGWQRSPLSNSMVSENTDDSRDPIKNTTRWWTEGNISRSDGDDGGNLYQDGQENRRPRPGLTPEGGVDYLGTSNTALLSNVGGCSVAYDKALEYSGEFLDRHGVVRYSGVWDRVARKLQPYDSVFACSAHFSQTGVDFARIEYRAIYQRFLDDLDVNTIDVSGWRSVDDEDGVEVSPPTGGDNGRLAFNFDPSTISLGADSPNKFSWGNSQPRGSCANIFASLTVVPDDDESGYTIWREKFRPPINWDPTDKPNMPFMGELEDIEDFNLGGNNPNFNDATSNYEGSFQKYYPEVDMDGVQYGWVRQPVTDQGAGENMTRGVYGNYWKLWDFYLKDTWVNGDTKFAEMRLGSTRLLLSPSDQDDSVQGFSNCKANARSEYGSNEAMIQEPAMLLAFDKNADTDPLLDTLKTNHGLDSEPEALRQRLRRVLTQKGIDLYGAYASLGKWANANAGHGEPYDWYMLYALGTVDSVGDDNSRDKFKDIFEGNIGNEANGTKKTTNTEEANDNNGYGSFSENLYNTGSVMGVQWNISNSSPAALPGPIQHSWGESHSTGGMLHAARLHSVIATNVTHDELPPIGDPGGPTSAFAWGTPTGTPTNRDYQTLTIKAPLPTTCGGGYGSGFNDETDEWDIPPSGVEGLYQTVDIYNAAYNADPDNKNDNRKIRPIYDQVTAGIPIPHDKLYFVNGYDTNQSYMCDNPPENDGCACCNWSCRPPTEIFGFNVTRQGKGLWNMAINKAPYFATNKFVGFYVRNVRNNKVSRILAQGVDRADGECGSGDALKGIVYPTNMDIVLTLQEDIGIENGDKVDLVPATVQDINNGYAVFNDTGEMSSMTGLGNYDYVFTRGQCTVALITRLLTWSDPSIANSIAGIRAALPSYWKPVYDKIIGFSTYGPLRFKGFTPNYGATKLLYNNNSTNCPGNSSGATIDDRLDGLADYPNPDLIEWKEIGWPTLFRAFIRSLLLDQLDKPPSMAHYYGDILDQIYRWPSCSADTIVNVCNTNTLGTISAVITDTPSSKGSQPVHVDDVDGNQISSLDEDGNPKLCPAGQGQCNQTTPPTNLADGIEFSRVVIPRDDASGTKIENLLGDCQNCIKIIDEDRADYEGYDAVLLQSTTNSSLDYAYVDSRNYKLHVWVAGTNKPVEMKLIAEATMKRSTEGLPQEFNWTQIWALPDSIKYIPHLFAKYKSNLSMTHFFAAC